MNTKNDFFDGQRFGKYVCLLWAEHRKVLVFSAILLYAVLTGIFCAYGYIRYDRGAYCCDSDLDAVWFGEDALALVAVAMVAALLGRFSLGVLSTRPGRMSFFALPVSTFEKYLGAWLTVFVGIVGSFGLVWLADLTRVAVYKMVYGSSVVISPVPWLSGQLGVEYDYFISSFSRWEMWVVLFGISSFTQLGAAIWQRFSFLKIGICLFVFLLANFWGALNFERLLYQSDFYYPRSEPVSMFFFDEGGIWFVVAGIMLFNWLIVYFRLRETDLVDRL